MNTGNKLKLPDVSVFTFCWGNEHVAKSIRSMLIAMDQIVFKRAILITDCSKTNMKIFANIIDRYKIDVYDTSLNLEPSEIYLDDKNRKGFCQLFVEQANKYIMDDFCLNVQHDSTVIDANKWTDEYLNYDYIGAPWPMNIIQASDMVAGRIDKIPNAVGNGGFSLRSKKFLEESVKLEWKHKNEDLNICIFNYDIMKNAGINFAPPELACKFSVEHSTPYHKTFDKKVLFTYNTFGFHGEFNIAGMDFINNYKKFTLYDEARD